MAANPRVDDLRKRLEKDPGSRLFAQLAEELRKDGDLDAAVTVCREGLQKHPAYPSARMTLGRALFDKGELTAARPEFEAVLKGAPDNILASRLLGECLDGLGDLPGAIERYKGTLVLAPGDKQILARIQEAESRLRGGGSGIAPPAALPVPPPEATVVIASPIVSPPPSAAEPPPIPLAAVMEESFELERPYEQPLAVASPPRVVPAAPAEREAPAVSPVQPASFDPPPIPVVEADEEFELERPHEAPLQAWVPATTPAPMTPARPSGMGVEFSFDDQGEASEVEEPAMPASVAPLPSFAPEFGLPAAPPPDGPNASAARDAVVEADLEVEPEVAAPEPEREIVEDVEAVVPTAPAVATPPDHGLRGGAAGPELISSTLAELYFNQGFTDKALDVYRQLLAREPGNERAQARMRELRALEEHLKQEEAREPWAPAPAPPSASPEMLRRQAVERTIARLEALLAAARKA